MSYCCQHGGTANRRQPGPSHEEHSAVAVRSHTADQSDPSSLDCQSTLTRSSPLSATSQAHPEPKRPAAAALNLLLNSSMDPKAVSIASFSSEEGPLLLLGLVITCRRCLIVNSLPHCRRGWLSAVDWHHAVKLKAHCKIASRTVQNIARCRSCGQQ